MEEFLATALSAPTLVFTILMGVAMLYWILVMIGALDLDVFDPGGALDGADGVADGAAEGMVEGAVEGAAEGATEGAAEGMGDAEAEIGGLGGLLAALHLRYAPVTVVLSLITLLSWLGTFFGSRYLAPIVPGAGWIGATVATLAAIALALPLTSLLTRPLAPLFETHHAKGNRDLIGSVVVVKTGRVDADFGQAELDDGQAGLLLRVRCEIDGALARGDRALIIGWNEETASFEVEPMEAVLGAEVHEAGAEAEQRKRRA